MFTIGIRIVAAFGGRAVGWSGATTEGFHVPF